MGETTRVDEAWKLEQEFWRDVSSGNAGAFYRRHLIADGFVVLPNGVVTRDELITKWNDHEPVRTYELSEPRFTLIDGGTVAISYHVTLDADWLRDYDAWMTALYTWEGSGWALVFRSHTPAGAFPF
jgi:hypothetical protein